jgi:hypothetical protein
MMSPILIHAFGKEMVKIAQEAPPQPDNRPFVTKERLKRLAFTVIPAAAIGTGLGVAVPRLFRKQIKQVAQEPWFKKYRGPIIGGASGIIGGLALYRARRIADYLEHGKKKKDENVGPKQPGKDSQST